MPMRSWIGLRLTRPRSTGGSTRDSVVGQIAGNKKVRRRCRTRYPCAISAVLTRGTRWCLGMRMLKRSYAMLLRALRKHLKNDCVAMGPSERFDYIVSIFSDGSLRRFSDYLDADISMMTIHSAKGLEWDIVFIPGVTRFDWPGGICSRCERAGMCSRSARGCRIVDAKKMPDGLIEEMGLLYVGVTRAHKVVYVSASMQRRTKYGNYQVACPSCLTSLPGIGPVSRTVMERVTKSETIPADRPALRTDRGSSRLRSYRGARPRGRRYTSLWVLLHRCCPLLFHQVVVNIGSREGAIFCSLHRLCPTDNACMQIEGTNSVVVYKGYLLICHVDML